MENSAPASPLVYESILYMLELAAEDGAILYNICYRFAGWAVQWYEAARDPYGDNPAPPTWSLGLVTYCYYSDLPACIHGEITRLEARRVTRLAEALARLEARQAARVAAAQAVLAASVAGPVDDRRAADAN